MGGRGASGADGGAGAACGGDGATLPERSARSGRRERSARSARSGRAPPARCSRPTGDRRAPGRRISSCIRNPLKHRRGYRRIVPIIFRNRLFLMERYACRRADACGSTASGARATPPPRAEPRAYSGRGDRAHRRPVPPRARAPGGALHRDLGRRPRRRARRHLRGAAAGGPGRPCPPHRRDAGRATRSGSSRASATPRWA